LPWFRRMKNEVRRSIVGTDGTVLYCGGAASLGELVEQAVRERVVLRGAMLAGANLACRDLRGAQLSGAYLAHTRLDHANLAGARLDGAILWSATLNSANLAGASLVGACLAEVFAADVYFRHANLHRGLLTRAYLSGADFRNADVRGVDLHDATLTGANFDGATGFELVRALHTQLPGGEIVGWKKALSPSLETPVIVKLSIPADAARVDWFERKFRAERAVVLDLEDLDGGPGPEEARGTYDTDFVYRRGQTVRPEEPFDPDPTKVCGSGIHFYLTRQEAVEHVI